MNEAILLVRVDRAMLGTVLLGRITKNAEVQVERAALVLTEDELFRVKLALDFEMNRIKRLIEEEDTPGRRANLAVAEKLSERLDKFGAR